MSHRELIGCDMVKKKQVLVCVLMLMQPLSFEDQGAGWVPSKSWKGESMDKAHMGTVCWPEQGHDSHSGSHFSTIVACEVIL